MTPGTAVVLTTRSRGLKQHAVKATSGDYSEMWCGARVWRHKLEVAPRKTPCCLRCMDAILEAR